MAEPTPLATEAGDGSMETILASIRRIIREDEAASTPVPDQAGPEMSGPSEPDPDEDELLVLEPSMIVQAPQTEEPVMTQPSGIDQPVPAFRPAAAPSPTAAELAAALFDDEPAPVPIIAAPIIAVPEAALPRPTHSLLAAPDDSLLAPQTRVAAAQSLAALQQAARPEPASPSGLRLLRSGGPTIEDLVRDELRVQLKHWLDANLPEMVERLVAREIERLVRPD